jgi:hypothetical protein
MTMTKLTLTMVNKKNSRPLMTLTFQMTLTLMMTMTMVVKMMKKKWKKQV